MAGVELRCRAFLDKSKTLEIAGLQDAICVNATLVHSVALTPPAQMTSKYPFFIEGLLKGF